LRKAQEQELTANARNLQRTREELTAATERLFRIQEQEREEISRDLHDDIGQRLAVLQMSVESLWTHLPATVRESNCSERDKIINLIGGLAEDLRDLSHRLHPSVLDHLGLAAALGELAEAFQESSRLPTRFSAREVPGELDPKISLAAYRIVQEALHNVRKHAGREATVTIALVGSATGLYLTIRDTGPGIDPQRLKSVNGLGLISMAQRAEMVGGKLTIDSHPGQGAIINVTIPFHAGAADKKSSDFDGGSGPSRSDGTSYTSGAHKPDERAQGARRKGSEDVKGER
jgi:two-component system CheB/CheR fusion protein